MSDLIALGVRVPVLLTGVLVLVTYPVWGVLFALWLVMVKLWHSLKRWLTPPRAATTAELEEVLFRCQQEHEAAELKAQAHNKRRLMHVLDRCWEATNQGTVASFAVDLEYIANEACLDGLIKSKRQGRRLLGYAITHKGRCAAAEGARERGIMHDWEVSADYVKSAAEDEPVTCIISGNEE